MLGHLERKSSQSEREVSPMQVYQSIMRVGLAVNNICMYACMLVSHRINDEIHQNRGRYVALYFQESSGLH
jgi:hypothetical protein